MLVTRYLLGKSQEHKRRNNYVNLLELRLTLRLIILSVLSLGGIVFQVVNSTYLAGLHEAN